MFRMCKCVSGKDVAEPAEGGQGNEAPQEEREIGDSKHSPFAKAEEQEEAGGPQEMEEAQVTTTSQIRPLKPLSAKAAVREQHTLSDKG